MASIELYINRQLCETENPENFSVYLKRQLLNPAELSTKDAQRSYDITLPATAVNNAIFGYINTEEVCGKFSQLYDAQLLVGGMKIFDGKFKLSEITKNYYKGNLGVPAQKSVKDIFGETMMNQAGEWRVPFESYTWMSKYNKQENDSPVIFPFVLYKLLKKPEGIKNSVDVLDGAIFSKEDFYPSVNVIQMLKQIFENAKYSLSGSGIDDERLKKLYVSYKNPQEYNLEWSAGKIDISLNWMNLTIDDKTEFKAESNKIGEMTIANVNLLKALNSKIDIKNGHDFISKNNEETIISIPQSGLYKVRMNVIYDRDFPSVGQGWYTFYRDSLNFRKTEVSLLRNFNENLGDIRFNNVFYQPNTNQIENRDGSVFPQGANVNFIDPNLNKNFICGFSFGKIANPVNNEDVFAPYRNPTNDIGCNPMAISGGRSWVLENKYRAYSVVNTPGYVVRNGDRYELTNQFKMELLGSNTAVERVSDYKASGQIEQVIWLEKDEKLTLVTTSDVYRWDSSDRRWSRQKIEIDLSIEPFMRNKNWLKLSDEGSSTVPMNWFDTPTFNSNYIDLMKFLPINIKINDWIDNFCKTFNLILINTGDKSFELNLKKNELVQNFSNIIDLDQQVSVAMRSDTSLKLPKAYELSFTIDTGEQGYVETMKIDEEGKRIINSGYAGGGTHYTGSHEINNITQTSFFSYCWYKELYDGSGKVSLKLPVITDVEIWEPSADYTEMSKKVYSDKAQRFWFKAGTISLQVNGSPMDIALVKNQCIAQHNLTLDYDNKLESITKNFFLLLDNNNHYTTIECFLSPEQYQNLDQSLVKFNSDIYNISEADGYDPMGKKKGVLKLLRKIL